jgi:hypothetical protein
MFTQLFFSLSGYRFCSINETGNSFQIHSGQLQNLWQEKEKRHCLKKKELLCNTDLILIDQYQLLQEFYFLFDRFCDEYNNEEYYDSYQANNRSYPWNLTLKAL